MDDDDKYRSYDAPRVGSYGEYDFDEPTMQDRAMEAGEKAGGFLKKNMKPIIGAIVVIAVAYFLLDFFVLSYEDLNISVVDTEGRAISSSHVRVYLDNSNEAAEEFTGSKTISVKKGASINADATASGYKSVSKVPVYPDGSGSAVITLEKDMDISITVTGIPENFVPTEEREITVELRNNGMEEAEVDLVFEGGFGKKYMDISFTPIDIQVGETISTVITVSVKPDLSDKESITGTIRVEGLDNQSAKAEFDFGILEFNPSKVSVSPSSRVDFGKVVGGSLTESKEIKISHTQKGFVLEDISFEIINIRADHHDISDVADWFEFVPQTIDEVEYGTKGKKSVDITITVPGDAEADKIEADIFISNPFWDKTLNLEADIEPSETELSISGVNSTYTLSNDDGDYISKNDFITLKNRGDSNLRNISIISPTCGSDYLGFNVDSFDLIIKDESKEFVLQISAPGTMPEDDSKICIIEVRYDDPKNPLGDRKKVEETLIIKT